MLHRVGLARAFRVHAWASRRARARPRRSSPVRSNASASRRSGDIGRHLLECTDRRVGLSIAMEEASERHEHFGVARVSRDCALQRRAAATTSPFASSSSAALTASPARSPRARPLRDGPPLRAVVRPIGGHRDVRDGRPRARRASDRGGASARLVSAISSSLPSSASGNARAHSSAFMAASAAARWKSHARSKSALAVLASPRPCWPTRRPPRGALHAPSRSTSASPWDLWVSVGAARGSSPGVEVLVVVVVFSDSSAGRAPFRPLRRRR